MIGTRSLVTVLAAAVASVLPASASAETANVGIQSGAFGPDQVSILAGDTVEWLNQSLKTHTVTSRDGLFGSPHIGLSGSFSQAFPSAGTFAYYCQIHPFMSGEVDVFDVLLTGPALPVTRGDNVALGGRASAGVSTVEIQADTGGGFADVATAAVDGSGAFETTVPATVTGHYRAVAGSSISPSVQVVVIDRSLQVHASRLARKHGQRKHFDFVRVRVVPADPGATVVLQLDLRERFGWWPAQRRKLDSTSGAVFRVRAGLRARVVLTLPDGWTPVITSTAMRLAR
jgi:plastocyanin